MKLVTAIGLLGVPCGADTWIGGMPASSPAFSARRRASSSVARSSAMNASTAWAVESVSVIRPSVSTATEPAVRLAGAGDSGE